MKIKSKIFLVFAISAIVLSVSSYAVIYYFTAQNVKDDLFSQLQMAADNKAGLIDFYINEKKADIEILANSSQLKEIFSTDNLEAISLTKESIKNTADRVANEVNQYILDHPDMTLTELQDDPVFNKIAVQKVGDSGYTALTDYNSLICRFHKNSETVNLDLHVLADVLPGFWGIMSQTEGGKESDGFYDWKEPDGTVNKKYMYISIIDTKTADGVGLSVAATTYLDEYGAAMDIARITEEYLLNIKNTYEYEDLFLIDLNGEVWWSAMQDIKFGNNLNSEQFDGNFLTEVFQKTINSDEILFSDYQTFYETDSPVIFMSAPLHTQIENELLGAIIVLLKPDQINKIVSDDMVLGKTGEIYIVGDDYLMRSDSKFLEEKTMLKQLINTDNVKHCFENTFDFEQHVERDRLPYINYRGIKSIGAHRAIKEMNWCIVTEMSSNSWWLAFKDLFWVFVSIALVVIFLFYIIARWLGKSISSPIKSLQEDVEIIEEGNLNHKIDVLSRDEIGQLALAFGKMTQAIKKSKKEVDKKVQTQTDEIIKQKHFLENQQKAILNVLEDVDEEKVKVSMEKDRINTILYSIGDGVFVVDNDKRIIVFNKVAANLSGFHVNDVLGKKYDKVLKFVFDKDDKPADRFIDDAMKTGEIMTISQHVMLVKKDGDKLAVDNSAAPLKDKDGNVIGCVVIFRDVTEERKIEKMKSEFVSVASHQLRTPLTGIKWFTELLLTGEAGKLSKKQIDFIQNVSESNERMIKLVEDLLNVSRIETGRKFDLEIAAVDVVPLIKDIVQEQRILVKNRKTNVTIKFSKSLPKKCIIELDERKMRQVIFNLINNAVKYSKEKGWVEVGIQKGKNDTTIYVKDNGIGIPKNQQKRIFQKFFRADNVALQSTEGTGLGLYIAKAIVEVHGGRLWFESKTGKGTTFFINIPNKYKK